MGGRGASSGNGGGRGKFTAKGELTLPNGSKIEFDGDLKYYGDDKAVTGAVRKSIETWEAKRVGAKIEYAYSVDANGNMIDKECRGGKGSVRATLAMHATDGATFTHNHPRGDGMLGGTFSTADLHNFAFYGNTTARATAKEGTYSISKTKNFDKTGFNKYVAKVNSDCSKKYKTDQKKLGDKYLNSSMSRSEYEFASAKLFNNYLIDLHNGYKAGEKQYGYTYTLEKK